MMMNDRETPSSAGGRPFFSPDETSPEVSNTLRRRRLEDDEGDDDDDGGGGGDDANTTTEVTDFSSSLTGMMDEEFGDTLAEIQEGLQIDELEAEQEDAAEDAQLEAEGFVDGTPPIDENDEMEGVIETEEEGGDDDDDDDDDDDVDQEMLDAEKEIEEAEEEAEEIEQEVEDWLAVEEWKEATEEHDKEWFAEYERTHGIESANEDASGGGETGTEEEIEEAEEEAEEIDKEVEDWEVTESEKEIQEVEKEIEEAEEEAEEIEQEVEDWLAVEEWKEATEEHDKEWFAEYERTHGIAPIDKDGWTGENEDTDTSIKPPSPAPPTAPPPAPTIDNWGSPVSPSGTSPTAPTIDEWSTKGSIDCSGIVGQVQCTYTEYPLAFFAAVAFLPLVFILCIRKLCCQSKPDDAARGEYRQVAAQYGEMGYDNTFSDALSDDEDDDFLNGNGDVEDDSWGKSGKRTMEMTELRERNGGLSLAEMNG